jgi:hypothetical protein
MCTNNSSKRSVSGVRSNLKYIQEDVVTALEYAKDIKDPELTKKLEDIKAKAAGAQEYLASRVDPKRG